MEAATGGVTCPAHLLPETVDPSVQLFLQTKGFWSYARDQPNTGEMARKRKRKRKRKRRKLEGGRRRGQGRRAREVKQKDKEEEKEEG